MSEVRVTSVQPSEVGAEMVAYLLTVSILAGEDYSQGHHTAEGLPLINGRGRDEILRTYALALNVVKNSKHAESWLKAAKAT